LARLDLAATRAEARRAQTELLAFDCISLAEINYSSNATVSASLRAYVEDRTSVDTATWDTVWNNSRVTIHHLTGEKLFVFIVWFEDLDTSNRVFYLTPDGGCWLNRSLAQ
jgi:hypothetical protein